jgi:hypothetical protein
MYKYCWLCGDPSSYFRGIAGKIVCYNCAHPMDDINGKCSSLIGKHDDKGFWCCMPHCQEEVARRNAKKSKKISKSQEPCENLKEAT